MQNKNPFRAEYIYLPLTWEVRIDLISPDMHIATGSERTPPERLLECIPEGSMMLLRSLLDVPTSQRFQFYKDPPTRSLIAGYGLETTTLLFSAN